MPTPPASKNGARHDLVMGQLMEAATQLFAQRGFAGTSIQDLAAAVGLTRTGIYHYVRGKEDILEHLVRGFTLDTARDLERLAAETGEPVLARLREGIVNMVTKVATQPQRFLLMLNSESAFPESLAKQYRLGRRRTVAALTSLVTQAIVDGVCRPVDADLAAHSILGTVTWVASWYPRAEGDGALPPGQLACRLAEIALGGLVAPRQVSRSGNVAEVIDHLREDLNRLQLMVDAHGK